MELKKLRTTIQEILMVQKEMSAVINYNKWDLKVTDFVWGYFILGSVCQYGILFKGVFHSEDFKVFFLESIEGLIGKYF